MSLSNKLLIVIFLCSLFALVNANVVSGKRSVLHEMPDGSFNIFLTHLNEKEENSLLFKKYKQRIEDYFFANGHRIVENVDESDLVAFISYGVGPAIVNTVSIPVYGSSTASTFQDVTPFDGVINPVSISVTTYGRVGTDIRQFKTFPRNLALDIYKIDMTGQTAPNKVFEGKVNTEGMCGDIDYVLNEMLIAMFAEFPGPSSDKSDFTLPVVHSCLN
jgi:hypothetical protein